MLNNSLTALHKQNEQHWSKQINSDNLSIMYLCTICFVVILIQISCHTTVAVTVLGSRVWCRNHTCNTTHSDQKSWLQCSGHCHHNVAVDGSWHIYCRIHQNNASISNFLKYRDRQCMVQELTKLVMGRSIYLPLICASFSIEILSNWLCAFKCLQFSLGSTANIPLDKATLVVSFSSSLLVCVSK